MSEETPRRALTRRVLWAMVAVLLLVALGFWQQYRLRHAAGGLVLQGKTMGTTYSVRTAGPAPLSSSRLQQLVEARLEAVNASMSTWDAQSELSRINAAPAGTPLPLGEDLRTVLAAALALSRATDGAFDPTVGPLVNLWGFGPTESHGPPSDAEIAAARARSSYRYARLEDGTLTKARDGLYIDLSAIAKGFGVDAVARVLEAQGFTDYVVEIGGDLVVRGRNPQGRPWGIGIEEPLQGAPQGELLEAVVRVERGALATSGSYRRYRRTQEGLRHHIIDPRTGRPTQPGLVAVTVYAPDCMTADGIATALMVLGVEQGMDWVEQRPDVEALFIEAQADGTLRRHVTSGFPPLETPR